MKAIIEKLIRVVIAVQSSTAPSVHRPLLNSVWNLDYELVGKGCVIDRAETSKSLAL